MIGVLYNESNICVSGTFAKILLHVLCYLNLVTIYIHEAAVISTILMSLIFGRPPKVIFSFHNFLVIEGQKYVFKGTVARDFSVLVFFIKSVHLGPEFIS